MNSNAGRVLGSYRLLACLGRGGMGEVWEAESVPDHTRRVAVKTLPVSLGQDPLSMRMLMDEARICLSLNHPNVVRMFDSGVHDGQAFMAMELLVGRVLASLLTPGERLPLGLCVGLGLQLLAGLKAAHQREPPIIHRDIKPSNLFVTTGGVLKIIDFGIAVGPVDRTRTLTNVVKGSLPYLSPEQLRSEPTTTRSDLFSAALVLHEIVCGQRVYERSTDAAILTAILFEPVPPLRSVRTEAPAELEAVLQSALEKDSSKRLKDAVEFAASLERCLPSVEIWSEARIGEWVRARMAAEALVRATTESETASIARESAHLAPPPARPRKKVGWRALAFTSVVAAVGLGVGFTVAPISITRVAPEPPSSPSPPSFQPPQSSAAPVPEAPKKMVVQRAAPRPTAAPGLLTVNVEPWGNVYVDGRFVGPTPVFRLSLKPGRHALLLVAPDGHRKTRTVVLSSGKEERVVLEW